MEKQIERMRKLSAMLQAASKAYYQEDKEIMSNLEYDRLYDELAALEKETGIVLSGSPTVTARQTGSTKIRVISAVARSVS